VERGLWLVAFCSIEIAGGEALDHVDIGLVHQLKELAGVGGQAFHVTALAFGIQRVKRQAGFARPRQPGDHHQLVARNVEVDVLEVVRSCAADADSLVAQHCGQIPVVRACRRRQGVVVEGICGRSVERVQGGCASGKTLT
jgi:hypothetical protein